ncbi:MAG: matrixin family metalloprotease [Gemmatimonadetes bacterium]|nr:matrixin family metalloprotease [Gemmatimonadota bacterium]
MPILGHRRHVLALSLLCLAAAACSRAPGGSAGEGAVQGEQAVAPGSGTEAAGWACGAPIGWKVGFVDARFGVPGAELRSAIEEAVGLWEAAASRQLFRHDPHAGMPVDLEYDDRQQQLDEKAREERQLDAWVEQLSRRPRTHAEAERYNRLVDRYNAALDAYESRPTLRFQVAEYSHVVESPSGRKTKRRIVVWAVDGRSGLVGALAHELGHALGLGHVDDSSAVMRAEGESCPDGRAALHAADLEELGRVCGSAR